MKIALIGPGIIEIPPQGWGAVESLIWDYATELGELGHEGVIINTPDHEQILNELLEDEFDFIHVHYDVFYFLMDIIQEKCPKSKIAISSHYPYIDQKNRHLYDGYDKIYEWLIANNKYYNFCISDKDYTSYLNDGADKSKLIVSKNGAQHRDYFYTSTPNKSDRTLYLGKIEKRKRQSYYQSIDNIDYVGKYCPGTSFDLDINYLGEWDHQTKLNSVSHYGNMMLLSDGENGTPLVIKEALICGLGVVISKYASDDLDKSLPFVTIIDDEKWNDISYVSEKLEENRKISLNMREEIREYGIKNFSWKNLVEKYAKHIENIIK